MEYAKIGHFAIQIRRNIIEYAYNTKQGVHIGGALSMADILAVLYGSIMRFDTGSPEDGNRDRLILSKGHDCLGLYAALNILGIISDDELRGNYLTDGGFLPTHTVKNISKGIECTGGSLGMGISYGIGKALAAKLDKRPYRTFAIVGDGECNEGEIWEAAAAARQYKLDNLIVIVDRNELQSDGATKDIMDINIASVFSGFGWRVSEVNGHETDALEAALTAAVSDSSGIPCAVVANTVKGKGISFMENNNAWHHGKLSQEQYLAAREELNID